MYRLAMKNYLTLFLCIFCPLLMTVYGQDVPDEFINGKVERIQSNILGKEHVIFVYLPTNYSHSDRVYPVHYITDAPATSNLFYDLVRLHSFVGALPYSIVVGLSSDNREHNLHPEKGAKKYLQFVEHEVIPFVEKNYRTEPFRSISGHSLGGGFAIYAFLSRTELFNLCFAGSPYPLEYLINMIKNENTLHETSAFKFLYSSIGTKNDVMESQFDIFQKMVKEKAPENVGYSFHINKGENHISNIAINFQNGLQTYYADWQFELPDTLNKPAHLLLANHYDSLSHKLGYSVKPDEWDVIYPLMDRLAQRGDFENAIHILKYCLKLYPQSDQAYAFLARAYLSLGDNKAASTNLDLALSINPQNKFALELKAMLEK